MDYFVPSKFALSKSTSKISPDAAEACYKVYPNVQQIKRCLVKKTERVSVPVEEHSLSRLKLKALEAGIPYQKFMGRILEEYLAGASE